MQLVSEGDTPFMSALVRSNRIAYRSSDHPSAFSGAVLASSSTATSICEYTGSIGSSLRIFWIVAHEASQFPVVRICSTASRTRASGPRSEEHTSELQSRLHLVCRLLLEKKKTT